MKKTTKLFVLFVFCFLGIFALSFTASADMGPKPSVKINFDNLNLKVVTTLVSKEDNFANFDSLDAEAKQNYFLNHDYDSRISYENFCKFVDYTDSEGYYFLGNLYYLYLTKNEVNWTNNPPKNFKLLLYFVDSDKFVESSAMETYSLNSYYTIDMNNFNPATTNSLPKINQAINVGTVIGNLLIRICITLVVELAIAFIFIRGKWKVFGSIAIVNVITQIILNITIHLIYLSIGSWSYILVYFPLEIGVIIIEAIAYCFIFKRSKDEITSPKSKAILYAIIANGASFAIGMYLLFCTPLGLI